MQGDGPPPRPRSPDLPNQDLHLKKENIFIFNFCRQREREGEREGEKHQCVRETSISWMGCLSHTPNWRTWPTAQACALSGMEPTPARAGSALLACLRSIAPSLPCSHLPLSGPTAVVALLVLVSGLHSLDKLDPRAWVKNTNKLLSVLTPGQACTLHTIPHIVQANASSSFKTQLKPQCTLCLHPQWLGVLPTVPSQYYKFALTNK